MSKRLKETEQKLLEEISQKAILETYKSQLETKLNEMEDKYQKKLDEVLFFK